VVEAYYNAQATKWLTATVDYQFVANPAYNADRGPVSILGVRLHASF
jgi:high affinity Mn2+ porin